MKIATFRARLGLLTAGLAIFSTLVLAAPAPIAIIRDGRANAAIVTPDQPGAVETYAAEELVYHLAKATGVTLSIVTESAAERTEAGRIYLGDTRAARAAGIEGRAL